jgi:hypothetical protein
MRFARGDVRDHIVSPKIDHGPSLGATERDSGREIQKSTFARFLVLSDFRLLQQYPLDSGHSKATIIDMCKSIDGLAMLVQGVLRQDPFSGHLFVFRGRKANLLMQSGKLGMR